MAPLPSLLSSRSTFDALHSLIRRQNNGEIGIIPPSYQANPNDLPAGAIAGIVLAAVFGTLFIVWIIWWARVQAITGGVPETEEVIIRRDPPRRSRRGSGRSEYRRSRSYSPRRRTQIVDERVMEERIPVHMTSRGHSPVGAARMHETVIVDGARPPRRYSGEDVVIVEEESDFSEDPRYKRRRSRRSSGYW